MKWSEYKVEGWENLNIAMELQFDNIRILLLKLNFLDIGPIEGRKNLIAIDEKEEIIWIANIPVMQGNYGSYDYIEKKDNLLLAWGCSIYCEIEPTTGNILKEMFVK